MNYGELNIEAGNFINSISNGTLIKTTNTKVTIGSELTPTFEGFRLLDITGGSGLTIKQGLFNSSYVDILLP